MSTHITVEQLEKMKTHELADLLASVVMVLRRLPDVPCRDLQLPGLPNEVVLPPLQVGSASYSQEEIKKMKPAQLKEIANALNIQFPTRIIKDDLIAKILARQAAQGHSEQYSIQHI